MKVQRPGVLETVTIDLFIIRRIGQFLKRFPEITTDFVALLDEWAARFFEELDYVREGNNATLFAEQMKQDLPQVRFLLRMQCMHVRAYGLEAATAAVCMCAQYVHVVRDGV